MNGVAQDDSDPLIAPAMAAIPSPRWALGRDARPFPAAGEATAPPTVGAPLTFIGKGIRQNTPDVGSAQHSHPAPKLVAAPRPAGTGVGALAAGRTLDTATTPDAWHRGTRSSQADRLSARRIARLVRLGSHAMRSGGESPQPRESRRWSVRSLPGRLRGIGLSACSHADRHSSPLI